MVTGQALVYLVGSVGFGIGWHWRRGTEHASPSADNAPNLQIYNSENGKLSGMVAGDRRGRSLKPYVVAYLSVISPHLILPLFTNLNPIPKIK